MDLIVGAFADALSLILHADAALVRISALSLAVSGSATALATLLGVPLGVALHLRRVPGSPWITLIVRTGMGLPPVVVGLVVFLLLARAGPLGSFRLLYTPSAMALAQCIVALPLIAGFTASALDLLEAEIALAMRVDGADEFRVAWELFRAARTQVVLAIAAGFGRAIAEVGASLMVGGNIVGQTRVLTTAIALETGRGEFALALGLGLILLVLAFAVNGALWVASDRGRRSYSAQTIRTGGSLSSGQSTLV